MDALGALLRWTGWGVVAFFVVPLVVGAFHEDLGNYVGGFLVFGGPILLVICYALARPLLRWGELARRGVRPRRWAALFLAAEAALAAYAFTYWRAWWTNVYYFEGKRFVEHSGGPWGGSDVQVLLERTLLLGFASACVVAALIVLWPTRPAPPERSGAAA